MTIIVEDGTYVAGANSYASVEQLDAYAAARGITLPNDTAAKEALLVRAMDYIESKSTYYLGAPAMADQLLAWPRQGVLIGGRLFSNTAIPSTLVEAQLDVAANAHGIDLMSVRPPTTKGAVVQESVGPISVSYAAPVASEMRTAPYFPKADSLLAILMSGVGGQIKVRKA